MSRAVYKMKKYKKTEVKALESSIKGFGKENLSYIFGDDLVEYEGDSYLLDVAEKHINSLYLGRLPRKDAIYLVDVLISADKEFFEGLSDEKIKQFFYDSFIALSAFLNSDKSSLRSTYPNENVVSAVVVNGLNPCMHVFFVPVTNDGRLSAKKIINTKMLFSLRKHLFETVWAGFGLSESLEKENLFLKFDLDQIRTENDPIRNTKTVVKEEKECLMVELDVFKNGSDQLKRLGIELKEISIENASLRDENLELMFEIGDLRDENRALQEKIVKLEMKNSATDGGQDNFEMKSNIAPFDPKSWTVVQGQELTLLRLCFDFLLHKYVGSMASIDSLPDSSGKENLKRLREHYEKRGGKS